MSDRITELEAMVSMLADRVASLSDRLTALEAERGASGERRSTRTAVAPRPPLDLPAAQTGSDPDARLVVGLLTLGGRTLLALAGGFVLRALTEGGATPGWIGLTLGLVYAVSFAALAERAALRGNPASATAHGLATLLLGFPLLYESVARFQLLGASAATAALAAFTLTAILFAYHRRLLALAWLFTAGGMACALAIMFRAERGVPGVIFLALLAVECSWLDQDRKWRGLRWVSAVVADLCALGVAVRSLSAYSEEGPRAAMVMLTVVLAATIASLAVRSLVLARVASVFEAGQVVGAVGAALGGAAIIAARTPVGAMPLGAAAALCGTGAYLAAFTSRHRIQGRSNLTFFASAGALLVLTGTALALGGSPLLFAIWSPLGIASAALSRRLGWWFAVHSAVYTWGSAVVGGLTAVAADALYASAAGPVNPGRASALVPLVAAVVSAWLASPPASATPRLGAHLPRLAFLLLIAWGATGLVVAALAPSIAAAPGAEHSPAALAALRTAALVATSALFAWISRREAWREAGWISHVVLGITGVKILLEDLPGGRPASLVVTFGVYGAALLLIPRLRLRRRGKVAPGEHPRAAAG